MPPAASDPAPARLLPVDGDAADPRIVRAGQRLYLFTTNSGLANVPVRSAPSLEGPWSAPADALARLPRWAAFGRTWRPEPHRFGNTWVLYFTARSRATGYQCIGVATAHDVAGPYTPTSQDAPWICDPSRYGSLDGRVVSDLAGSSWLVWKDDAFRARLATRVYVQQLASDGLSLLGSKAVLVEAPGNGYESSDLEAPQLVRDGRNRWWLFASVGPFGGPGYHIAVASCGPPPGPCSQPATTVVAAGPLGGTPGEQSLYEDASGRWWIVYNPVNQGVWNEQGGPTPPRSAAFAGVDFSGSVPRAGAAG